MRNPHMNKEASGGQVLGNMHNMFQRALELLLWQNVGHNCELLTKLSNVFFASPSISREILCTRVCEMPSLCGMFSQAGII
jgi:hypothetical protein